MFTGIIETLGQIITIAPEQSNLVFTIKSALAPELSVDQSVSHNGVCLTVTQVFEDTYTVTAIAETLNKTTLGSLKMGDYVNLERATVLGARLDGHLVQGHVDLTGICDTMAEKEGSWHFGFTYTKTSEHLTIPKGSITINGVSLTVVDAAPGQFSVAIIPYTFKHTTFNTLAVGDAVNLEFDVIGKYVAKYLSHFK